MIKITKRQERHNGLRAHRFAAALALVTALGVASCAPQINLRGHVPNPESLALIKPGQQTRDQVLDMLGSPTAIGTFEDTRWYYITRKTEQLAFYEPDLIEATIVLVEFDQAGFVKQVAHLSNDQARDIDPVSRTTPTKGRELSVIEQLLGNLGVAAPRSR
jgi:outer membrane protein assembly factor BamE (lipoprotein component of BamABCDE complex)